jgi:hypothetical protein
MNRSSQPSFPSQHNYAQSSFCVAELVLAELGTVSSSRLAVTSKRFLDTSFVIIIYEEIDLKLNLKLIIISPSIFNGPHMYTKLILIVSDRGVRWDVAWNLREMWSTQVGVMREGPAPQAGSKIPPAGKESTAPWSGKKTGRSVRHDKEDPSCIERGLLNVLCKCSLSMCVNIIDIIKPSCTVSSLSHLLIYFM